MSRRPRREAAAGGNARGVVGLPSGRTPILEVAAAYQPLLRRAGLDAEEVFRHPRIRVWRSIGDRENATLDVPDDADDEGGDEGDADASASANASANGDGRRLVRLHIKRYRPAGGLIAACCGRGAITPGEEEARGIQALERHGIPTAPLVAWGALPDGRSFVILEDLAGYAPGDRLVESGVPFEPLLVPTADLAARLHAAGLHHRDLYLNHFFARAEQLTGAAGTGPADLRLIDAARVRPLPAWWRQRWVVKDLAQFWYSTLRQPTISDEQRGRWLARYAGQRGLTEAEAASLRRAIERKIPWMRRHDARLNRRQPGRNIRIPAE